MVGRRRLSGKVALLHSLRLWHFFILSYTSQDFQHFPHVFPTFFQRLGSIVGIAHFAPYIVLVKEQSGSSQCIRSVGNRYDMAYLREKKMKEIENLLINFTSAEDDGEHRPGHG